MKKICFVALAALVLSACNSEPKFKVEGEVSGADGKMLYLEAAALEGIVPLDSVKLKGDGSFSFKQTRPESPEFYRLRVDDKVINFSVDSTETIIRYLSQGKIYKSSSVICRGKTVPDYLGKMSVTCLWKLVKP